MALKEKVLEEIKKQYENMNQEFVTPYTVSRAMGFSLSGRISSALKFLESKGHIRRTYKSGNECFIDYVEEKSND